jgi:hypothetical protein
MDENLQVLVVLATSALVVGLVVAVLSSHRIRDYGLMGTLRRRFSGGGHRSEYDN